jgi:predicted  nucleic acid-binding Zn-ribbon protein
MIDFILMSVGLVCVVGSFVFLEIYRIGISARELNAMRNEIRELRNEIDRLRSTIEDNEKDHFIMRQMVDEAVRACKRNTQ